MRINLRILLQTQVVILFMCLGAASASRVVFPPGPEFNTPLATNGFVGGPTEFSVIGNVTFQNCNPFSAEGMIVIMGITICSREQQYILARDDHLHQFSIVTKQYINISITAGAAALIYWDNESNNAGLGRRSRVPISNSPLQFPVVIISNEDYFMLNGMLQNATYVEIEITPATGQNVGGTGWFITLNIIFGLFYLALLALVIYKFVRKVKATGFVWNISFVYLFLQAAFCALMIARWFDPMLNWGFYSTLADSFIDTWPATWSFAALILMAFFWFEVINQFADTKVQAFLSKKMQIPFWIFVATIIWLPPINSILLNYVGILDLFVALLAIQFVAGMIVACFYIVVAVKALQVLKRSERVNVDKKSRVNSLMRNRVSIIISTIIAFIYPPCNFILRYNLIFVSIYFELAVLLEESVFLGLITFIQVWFMPDKSPGMSSKTGKGTTSSVMPAKNHTTTSSDHSKGAV